MSTNMVWPVNLNDHNAHSLIASTRPTPTSFLFPSYTIMCWPTRTAIFSILLHCIVLYCLDFSVHRCPYFIQKGWFRDLIRIQRTAYNEAVVLFQPPQFIHIQSLLKFELLNAVSALLTKFYHHILSIIRQKWPDTEGLQGFILKGHGAEPFDRSYLTAAVLTRPLIYPRMARQRYRRRKWLYLFIYEQFSSLFVFSETVSANGNSEG